MEAEKVPSPTCSTCGSYQVIITSAGIECDECSRVVGFSIKKPKLKERCDRVYRVKQEKEIK